MGYFPDQRLKQPIHAFPTNPSKIHHYINLTNGIEAIPRLQDIIGTSNINICRLQSSYCEASRPDLLIPAIDASMLFWLAKGHTVLVYDFGSRNKKRGAPRAIWYGLEFLKYVLGQVWYDDRDRKCFVRGTNAQKDFNAIIQKYVDRATMKKIKYYKQYCPDPPPGRFENGVLEEHVKLYGVYASTVHDADQTYYQDIARDVYENETFTQAACSDAYIAALNTGIPFDERYGKDRMHPIEDVLGMRCFLGGISHDTFLKFYSNDV